MPGIGVISNRNARLNKLHPELKDELAYVIGSNGEVSSTGTITDAYKAVETFRKIGIDLIAISGGDGTAHRTLEIVVDVYGNHKIPPILLLPTGTQNMVPRSFGIDGSGLANLMLAMLRYRHNVPMQCIRRNLLRVNNHLSFMFGFGVAARFMVKYYESGQTNPKGAAKILTQLVASAMVGSELTKQVMSKVKVRVEQDGEFVCDAPMHTFFASFVERLPLHFEIFPEAGYQEGKFQVVYSGVDPLKIAQQFPQILRGGAVSPDVIQRSLASKLVLDLEHPEAYTLDGELYPATDHFEIESGPELEFVIPALQHRAEDSKLRYAQAGPWAMRFLL
ncbi:MAG: NAD(+)/NADH kinase [Proteobacteria bacterium]|nr:NAD(+)/NADH kinase [Pseudomonadota bacterium]